MAVNIRIVHVGKTSEAWVRSGLDYYLQKLKRFSLIEVDEVPTLRAPKSTTVALQQKNESTLAKSRLKDTRHFVVLDKRGKRLSSKAFAQEIQRLESRRDLTFVVGGAFGFTERFLNEANEVISLSRMTLPHQLARIVLLEQLYRAFTILRGEKYHHE